jgi:hypothetical protein
MVKLGITRMNVDLKVLREGRDLMMFLPRKGRPPQRKEGMCTWNIEAHVQIMMYGRSIQVLIFI